MRSWGPVTAELDRSSMHAHLVGGGIASLAAAAILIRDGDMLGKNIIVYEQLDLLGGALDGSGNPEVGYLVRGGRMFESKYLCTYDLFSSIPTLDMRQTVTQEIFEWNEIIKTGSKARLIRNERRLVAPEFGLSEKQILMIERLVLTPESALGDSRISDHFDAAFFSTNFWFMWTTTFAFQTWHSAAELRRYLIRFVHMVHGFNRLQGIMRTVYNQYDSLVRPLRRWLEARNVQFSLRARVDDIEFTERNGRQYATALRIERDGKSDRIALGAGDLLIATLGSMTEGSAVGAMDAAPILNDKQTGGTWRLWERIAEGRPELGRPKRFSERVSESKWLSFTVTQRTPELLHHIRDLTGNVPGEGGLVTFCDSNWLMSVVVPHQPHFIDQPEDVQVFWGYALGMEPLGNFVKKPIGECTGREIMVELLAHLGLTDRADAITARTICLPCMMPFITSQFLTRAAGERPAVRPAGYANFAVVGQFCELPEDVVFTVEYSVRSAMTAVYTLLEIARSPPPVFKGHHDLRSIVQAFRALHDKEQ